MVKAAINEVLLINDVFDQVCVREMDGQLKIVYDIIKEHERSLHSKSIKELLVAHTLSKEEKVNLLKIKLDFIINGECGDKRRFLIVSIIATLIICCISRVGGLAIFLKSLYRLFQEGKISQALYKKILEITAKR